LPNKSYKPAPFCPTTSYTGEEAAYLIQGENMWLRFNRKGEVYAEGYSGNLDLSQTISTKTLTGTLAWDLTTKVVTGTGTAFLTELHLGSFVLGDGGAGATELLVVEKITSDTSFTISRKPTATATGKTGYVMPVVFPINTDIGTAIRGNVLNFSKGHYLGVGDGEFKINGSALSSTLQLSRTPRFALYDPSANTYTQDDVGISIPALPITLTAVSTGDTAITAATNASPIVISTAAAHRLYNGQEITISGATGNTAANGTWTITIVDALNFSLNSSTGNGAYGGSGLINAGGSHQRAGDYNVRVCSSSSLTLGFSNPSDVISPVTLAANQMIEITFNSAMYTDQDSYDIYVTPFEDNSTATVEARYMGPWYFVDTVTKDMLKTAAHTTGKESGTTYSFWFPDSEVASPTNLLSFDNFRPVDAEFVDFINGIPIYFSCQGKGTSTKPSGTSPGPAAVPSKPSNPEAVFLDKTVTTAGGDYIVGEFNAKSRIYALCQNSLQTVVLTTLDDEPIAFRSLWNSGFRNPYNVAFVKDYLFAFSTQKVLRSVAGGDDTTVEFEFATDIIDYVNTWETGHVMVAYDPKNRAVVYFYSALERRSGYWVTIALPFLLDKQVWNIPIILAKTNQDFIVSGVTTVGQQLVFLAGGRTQAGSITIGTYVFDGGDSETKDWYMAWNYSDDGFEFNSKNLEGFSFTGRFSVAAGLTIQAHSANLGGDIRLDNLQTGSNSEWSSTVHPDTSSYIRRNRMMKADALLYPAYTIRASGSYTTALDRLDEIVLDLQGNNSPT
jgi:hypothetical protein